MLDYFSEKGTLTGTRQRIPVLGESRIMASPRATIPSRVRRNPEDLPLQIELSQALPAAVLPCDGPGYRFVKQAAIQISRLGEYSLISRHLHGCRCLNQSGFGYGHDVSSERSNAGAP